MSATPAKWQERQNKKKEVQQKKEDDQFMDDLNKYADNNVTSMKESGKKVTMTSVMGAEKAGPKRRKMQWQEAMYHAQAENGSLRICWSPMYEIDPVIFDFEKSFHMKLLSLRLIGVELKELPSNIGEIFRHLQVLSLENNKLTSLPESISLLTDLRELGVAYNLLETLPSRIGYCYSLEIMTLNNNKLKELPITFGALQLVQRVDLEMNELTVLPENLDNMKSCHTMNLNNNLLTRLPRCLSKMPKLVSLSASWNQLSYIPHELCTSKTLQILRLSKNNIRIVPERIGDITTLREITLEYNKIIKLPLSFWKLKHLKTLRIEGNDDLVDPPSEVIIRGAEAVVKYCYDLYFYDKQARMRHIIYATQNILHQIAERHIANTGLFQSDIMLSLDGRHITDDIGIKMSDQMDVRDFWYAIATPAYFFHELIPKLQMIWQYNQDHRIKVPEDDLVDFPFSEREVMWAFSTFNDAYGPVLTRQRIMFKTCLCVDQDGNPKPCVPPKVGYMCYREAFCFKKHLIRQRDKEDRLWQAYKNNGILDAIKRSEVEARTYLDSENGKQWLSETAYEQAEEMLLDTGANKVVERRLKENERRKQKVIQRYDKKKAKVQRVLDGKLKKLNDELNKKKEIRKQQKPGYMRDILDQQITELTIKMAHLPEVIQLESLQAECEVECEKIEDELYDISSSDSDDVGSNEEDEDSEVNDSDAYSEEDSSSEAERWRRKRRRKQRQKELQDRRMKLERAQERFREIRTKAASNGLANAHSSSVMKLYKTSLHRIKQSKEQMQALLQPFIPLVHYLGHKGAKVEKKARRIIRNVIDVSKIRVRRALLKFNGEFDEVQRELKYEIYRQYIDHAVTIARDKARKEFNAIDQVRINFQGTSKEKTFLAWKKWVWTKQTRLRRDLRKTFKTNTRAYLAAMESVRAAQILVDMWVKEQDIYSDRPFWQHKLTQKMTYDEPTVYHYLPPGFIIPEQPVPLPSDIDINTTSSSEESLTEWQRKHGNDREAALEKALGKSKKTSVRSNVQTKRRNESRELKRSQTNNSRGGMTSSGLASDSNSVTSSSTGRVKSAGDFLRQQGGDRYNAGAAGGIGGGGGVVVNPMIDYNAIFIEGAQHSSVFDHSDNTSTTTATSNQTSSVSTLLQLPPVAMTNSEMLQLAPPMPYASPRPDDMNQVVQHIAKKTSDEYEVAYKAIRKKRNQLSKVKHDLYMQHLNRKPKSFEQLKAEQVDEDKAHMVEVEPGVFIDDRSQTFLKPTEEDLLRLAGGNLDMINTGKDGMELRTILAQRALMMKKKIHEQAVARGLAAPKKDSLWKREFKPAFTDNYQFSSSEDEEEQEKARKEARAAVRAKRKQERKEHKELRAKLKEVKVESDDD